MSHKTRGTAITVLSAVIFGLSPMWASVFRGGGGNPLLLTLFRNVIFLPVCLLLCRRAGVRPLPRMTGTLPLRLGFLALMMAGTQVLLFSSYNYMATGVCTTVHYVYPLLVFAVGALFFHERIGSRAGFCLLLCTAGLLCFWPRGEQISLRGFALAFGSGLTFALYLVWTEKGGFEGLIVPQLQFFCSLFGAAFIALCCAVSGRLTLALEPQAWFVGALAAGLMCLGVLLLQNGVLMIGARRASLLSTFEPITSLIVGFTLLHERLDLIAALGAVTVLLSVLLFYAPEKKKN